MRRGGFTLIELTVVVAIIALMLTMAVGAHYAWKRASALDAAEVRAVALLSLARQHAIASGRPAVFAFGNGTIPYADEAIRNSLQLSATSTNAYSGWCAVVAITNALEEADAWDVLEREDEFPIVGEPAIFPEPIQWGDVMEKKVDESGEIHRYLVLPDGGLTVLPDSGSSDINYKESFVAVTNVIFGQLPDDQQARFKAAQTRILELLPRSGVVRALSRDERGAAWGE